MRNKIEFKTAKNKNEKITKNQKKAAKKIMAIYGMVRGTA
jgi:hypothetical protein